MNRRKASKMNVGHEMPQNSEQKGIDAACAKSSDHWRILIVDDEQILREIWQDALQDEGYDVATAKDPEEALKMLDSREFDLVLLDQVFKASALNGLDALREMNIRRYSAAVIMMTGYTDAEPNIVKAVREGAYRHTIRKPSTLTEIMEIVRNCLLERSRETRESVAPEL